MERGEPDLALRLEAGEPHDEEVVCSRRGVVEQSRLADPCFAADDQRRAGPSAGRIEELIERPAFVLSTYKARHHRDRMSQAGLAVGASPARATPRVRGVLRYGEAPSGLWTLRDSKLPCRQ